MVPALWISKDFPWIWVDVLHLDSHSYLYYLQGISRREVPASHVTFSFLREFTFSFFCIQLDYTLSELLVVLVYCLLYALFFLKSYSCVFRFHRSVLNPLQPNDILRVGRNLNSPKNMFADKLFPKSLVNFTNPR